MTFPKKIYIAATGQNVGKTTVSLALSGLLQENGVRVAFCKPVGQKHIVVKGERAEYDTVAVTSILNIPYQSSLHSPVILGPGDTARYLKNPDSGAVSARIVRAAKKLESDYQTVIYEGTGHPGVGSVIDHSNVTVAKMLGADVILVAKGGIGKTLDRISLSKSYFDRGGVPVKGVIINQALPDKIDRIIPSLSLGLKKMGLPLLGTLPFENVLAFPTLAQIREAVGAKVIRMGTGLDVLIRAPVFGIQVDPDQTYFEKGEILLVSPVELIDRLFDSLINLHITRQKNWRIGGVMLSTEKPIPDDFLGLFEAAGIPVLATPLDTYTVARRLNNLVARVEPDSKDKISAIKRIFKEHIGLDFLKIIGSHIS